MARVTTGWFEFNGRRSTEIGVRLMDGFVYSRPEWRGESKKITGKSGDAWRTESATHIIYDTVDIKRVIRFNISQMDVVAAWLTGSGMLVFSYAPNLAYNARVEKVADFEQVSIGDDPIMEGSVTFTCQPYRYMMPDPAAITITESGTTITNPGTAPAASRVKITGSGDFSVTIGMETLFFEGVTGGGIIVDGELMDAFTYDGTLLANDRFEGTPWKIMPGDNVVSWMTEDGGQVESIEILPRWRCI